MEKNKWSPQKIRNGLGGLISDGNTLRKVICPDYIAFDSSDSMIDPDPTFFRQLGVEYNATIIVEHRPRVKYGRIDRDIILSLFQPHAIISTKFEPNFRTT